MCTGKGKQPVPALGGGLCHHALNLSLNHVSASAQAVSREGIAPVQVEIQGFIWFWRVFFLWEGGKPESLEAHRGIAEGFGGVIE